MMNLTGFQKLGVIWLVLMTIISAVFTVLIRIATVHQSTELFIQFPIIQYSLFILIIALYYTIKMLQNKMNPEKKSFGRIYKEYIRETYPDMYKKLYPLGLVYYNAYFFGLLKNRYDDGQDTTLNQIKQYHKTNMLLLLWGFLIAFVFTLINSL